MGQFPLVALELLDEHGVERIQVFGQFTDSCDLCLVVPYLLLLFKSLLLLLSQLLWSWLRRTHFDHGITL